jgi:murein DD-endopeptidase MepM/ murein hydrolase activator NlpD
MSQEENTMMTFKVTITGGSVAAAVILVVCMAGALLGFTGTNDAGDEARTPANIFSWPLPGSFTVTSGFGYRQDPFTGKVVYHGGTDIAAPEGTPIFSAADGTVTDANTTDAWGGGWGYYVKIDHGGEFETFYAHCSFIAVRVGEQVEKGWVVGNVGSAGRSTGNHLHWEIWKDSERTDALAYFED